MGKIIDQINNYYSSKIEEFGTTPQGVDWNSIESQELRFEVLSTLIGQNSDFSVLDFGCGFGSMYDYYEKKYKGIDYIGYDISQEMIGAALKKFSTKKNTIWTSTLPITKCDYVIASGIFNVKLENSDEDWLKYIVETMHELDSCSEKGFAFNVLTKYSDQEFMKNYLYYADPMFLFDYCKKHFSKNVALLHDYNLYEFTLIVRK